MDKVLVCISFRHYSVFEDGLSNEEAITAARELIQEHGWGVWDWEIEGGHQPVTYGDGWTEILVHLEVDEELARLPEWLFTNHRVDVFCGQRDDIEDGGVTNPSKFGL
jgi:hypothetical protein